MTALADAADLGTPGVHDRELPGVDGAVRVGCDVVRVERVVALLARRPAARDLLFTPREQADAVRDGVGPDSPEALRRLAARFAAKEAVTKLLSRPRLAWTDVEVRRGPDGAPSLWLRGEPCDVTVSLSHDGDVALAMVACAVSRLPEMPPR